MEKHPVYSLFSKHSTIFLYTLRVNGNVQLYGKTACKSLFVSETETDDLIIKTNDKCVKRFSQTFKFNEKTCMDCVEKVIGSFYNGRNFTFVIRS